MSAVKICHARGGGPTTPGDQTGTELMESNWYNGGWNFLARPKSAAMAEAIASAAEKGVKNRNIGYGQGDRNTARAQAKLHNMRLDLIDKPCNCDCSSFASLCAECAGAIGEAQYTYGNAPFTGNMRQKLRESGNFEILTDAKYLTSQDYLKRGDILVNEPVATGHAVVVTSDGDRAVMGFAGIHTGGDPAGEQGEPCSPEAEKAITSSHKTHRVVWGDTLWDIANTYGTTVDAICELNGLDPERFIYPEQVIVIPN